MIEGRQLSSYRIVSLLGTGGMGEVYRAYDEKLRRDVAIKVLRSSEADDEAGRVRLLREARAAAAVNHPNICTIHEVGEHDGQAFLAMELGRGRVARSRDSRRAPVCPSIGCSITPCRSPTRWRMPTNAACCTGT